MKEVNGRRLEIDSLRALSAIRKHGGITKAAVVLGLSQSAVSHKIKRLEISLDCELLGRKPGGQYSPPPEKTFSITPAVFWSCMTKPCSASRRRHWLDGWRLA